MRASTAKTLAAVVLTGVGSALVVGFRTPPTAAVAPAGVPPVDPTATGVGASGASGASSAGSASSAAPAGSARPGGRTYADGTFVGTAVGEPWGQFQVGVSISGGRIISVSVLQAPQDGRSSRINSQAVPMLTQAVIAAQGASVDTISGATWTSESYLSSLQAALDQSKAVEQAAG